MRRIAVVSALIVILAWVGAPSTANAQQRQKWWIGGGVGAGAINSSSDNVREDHAGGIVYVNLGGWVNPQWQLGIDLVGALDVGQVEDLDEPVSLEFAVVTVAYYPSLSAGFHIKGGVGASFATMKIIDEFGTSATADMGTDALFMAGAGWDVRLGRRFWLTPAVNLHYTRPGDLVLAGRTRVPNWTTRTVDFTVGIRFD
jgi:hypothetical protein